MNLPTILIGLVVAALLGLAIRYLVKNGMCATCEDRAACQAASKGSGASLSVDCGGQCSGCQFHDAELRAATLERATRLGE
jgi:microcystin degradation protein MlrC